MKLARLSDDKSEYLIKCRGITLTEDAGVLLPFTEFRKRVLEYRQRDPPMDLPQTLIKGFLLKEGDVGNIYTIKTFKKWEPLITKGMVIQNYQVVPFGYYDADDEKCKKDLHEYEMKTDAAYRILNS